MTHMRDYNSNGQARAFAKYRERLSALPCQKGERNARLLGIANLGAMAGLSDERMLAEIGSASGTPPLLEAEIRHALKTSRRTVTPLSDAPASVFRAWTPAPKPEPRLGSGAATYVSRMIDEGRGTTGETLRCVSPVRIPREPVLQTCAFLRELYSPDDLLFIGYPMDRGIRDVNILKSEEWVARCAHTLSQLVIANPLTGLKGKTKEGSPSYRCAACVARHRYALVEFDAMPLEDQAAFWGGVIRRHELPLRSLTYSGGKSIHALIEVAAQSASEWTETVETVLYAVSNPEAKPCHRADAACKDPNRLTRLPGAMRHDKGKRQSLLWLSPEA